MSALILDKPMDPLRFKEIYWPHVTFYDRQLEVIYSVKEDDETMVVAGHELGKDFVSAFICLWFFLCHHPVRVVTTSVSDDHLRVLWGEMGNYIDTAVEPLKYEDGGPLLVYHREIKKVVNGVKDKKSYMIGLVSKKGEGMAGHHCPNTLLVVDEASGVEDEAYERADTWANKKLVIGNPYPTRNFFYRGVKAGNLLAEDVL